MNRRQFTLTSGTLILIHLLGLSNTHAGTADAAVAAPEPALIPKPVGDRTGHLMIIGGAEDREEDKILLHKFVELTGAADPLIIVLTAASVYPDDIWTIYEKAFQELGVKRLVRLEIASRTDANNKALAGKIFEADGIFMTGGDQQRLMSVIGGTYTAQALYKAFKEHGACIGGTSAGAAVMSSHMMAEGRAKGPPGKGVARMSAGLGFVQGAIIDQHFSERQRLSRLLSLIAQAPFLLGVGIDENTALIIEKGRGLEVLGEGAVTIVDGRNILSNFFDVGNRELLEMLNIKLHLLPGGARYYLPDIEGAVPDRERSRQAAPVGTIPQALLDVVSILTQI